MSLLSKSSFLSAGGQHSVFRFSVFSIQRCPCGYKACKTFFGNEHRYANCCLKESTGLRSARSDWALTEINCNACLNTRRVCRTRQVCCIYWYKLLETKRWISACQMAAEPFLSVTNSCLDLNYFCLPCSSPSSTCCSPQVSWSLGSGH